ncbi:hypothetical protein [Bordetella trematum]|uniref:Type IV pilus assembly protein n=1 Tax=Bordetella trematum TaxID=123899 RepID=A0A157SVZ5_9BORD|nr:hypothetical protein [Bordetella trematum]SAI74116.1 type IV pilus assembly protein [Bordetella trematum]
MADAGLHVARDGVRWVYGLAWFAVLGSHAAGLARRRARQMRANRYVLGGVRAVAAGCARLPWRGRLFSAAQQVALQCAPGAVAAVLPVSGRYWLVAVQDGAVQAGGDRLFTQHEEAQAALERLTSAWEVASHDPAAVEQALAAPPSPGARLRRLSPGWPAACFWSCCPWLWGAWRGAQARFSSCRRPRHRRFRPLSPRQSRCAWGRCWTVCGVCSFSGLAGACSRRIVLLPGGYGHAGPTMPQSTRKP